jgi:signal transduction histidine kinase
MATEASFPDQQPGYPYRGPGLRVRVAPFATIAVLAEASLVLTSGPVPAWPLAVSLVLLLAVAAAFALPWERTADWLTVLVPLCYLGSVQALILAAGYDSGVGLVVLVPLIWTALFQRGWESGCVIAAIAVVEAISGVTPVAEPAGVISRRVFLWAALGTVIAVATHGLRERGNRAREEAARLHDQLTELRLVQDRDRIAATLRDNVIQQVHTAGLTLYSAAALTTQPEVRSRVLAAAEGLDDAVRLTREAVFAPEQRPRGRGLRAEIVTLCESLSPVPEISFRGPVDSAVGADHGGQILRMLRTALELIGPHTTAYHVAVSTSEAVCTAVIDTAGSVRGDADWTKLRDATSGEGVTLDIQSRLGGTQLTWSVSLA